MTDTFEKITPADSPQKEFNPSEDLIPSYSTQALDKLFAAAQPGAVFSAPVVSGNYTIITACEVMTGGGFGSGKGFFPASAFRPTGETRTEGVVQPAVSFNGSGMGGGGGAVGRPLAAIIIGPDGVKVQPVVDVTKIGLAVLPFSRVIAALLLTIYRTVRRTKPGLPMP